MDYLIFHAPNGEGAIDGLRAYRFGTYRWDVTSRSSDFSCPPCYALTRVLPGFYLLGVVNCKGRRWNHPPIFFVFVV